VSDRGVPPIAREAVAIGVVGAEQFNPLMWHAQHALPASQAVCDLEPLAQSDTVVKLLERLTVIKTAFRVRRCGAGQDLLR
jgi:hypothetical protein